MADVGPRGYLSDKQAEVAMHEHEPTPVHTTVDPQALDPVPPLPLRADDPRRITTHVTRHDRQRPGRSAFLAWPAASSMVFLLSAACLLGGAWTVFSALGIDPDQVRERLGMIGTVHLYELALVGVAVLLCRIQRANPDAIGPVILAACFVVGSTVTLDLVSIDRPWWTLVVGVIGVVAAVGKARVLAHIGGGASDRLLLTVLALLVSWNLLWPAAMGLYLHYSTSGLASAAWWMPGWYVVVSASALLVIGILRDDGVGVERLRPFLRRSSLRWVLGLAIAGCSALHLLVLGYVHSLDVTLGEILPVIALLCLGAVDLRHRAAGRAPAIDQALLVVPGILALVAVLRQEHGVVSNPYAAGAVFTPAAVMAGYAAALWCLGRHRAQEDWRWIAGGSAALGALLWGAGANLVSFNWAMTTLVVTLGLTMRAWLRGEPESFAKFLTASATILLIHPQAILWQVDHGIPPIGSLLTVAGSIVLGVALMWSGARPAIPRLALWLLTAGLLVLCGGKGAASVQAMAGGVLLLAVHVGAWWRLRDTWCLGSLLLPLAALVPVLMPTNKGWLAVWAAFALLAVGVAVSRARVRQVRSAREASALIEAQAVPSPTA